jgi:endonuclease/exonuclease/phosphatase family metal-dependent hydrolase
MRLWPLVVLLGACTRDTIPESPDAAPPTYPPPRTDLLPAIGSETTLEIATWNIENFPATAGTPSTVADVIASLDLDVVMVEEIANEAAWSELVTRLADTYDSILSTHVYTPIDYQKLGIIYRRSLVTASPPTLLFQSDDYTFPRPPLSVTITVDGNTIELVGVHLKAGVELEDAERRTYAIAALDARFRMQVDGGGEPEIVLLGDYNERVIDEADRAVLAPILTATDRYTLRTEPAAVAGGETYLGFGGSFIDHITTSAALDARWPTATTQVVDLRTAIPGYRDAVSDHLPVVLIAPR